MPSIDERVVAMSFENAKFEAGVAKTMATLAKLNESLKLTGAAKGLQDIEAAANKVTLTGASSAADKLKQKMEFSGAVKGLSDIEGAANKVTLDGANKAADETKGRFATMTSNVGSALDKVKEKLGFKGGTDGLNSIEAASNKVQFSGLHRAIDSVTAKLGFHGATQGLSDIQKAEQQVDFSHMSKGVDEFSTHISAAAGVAVVALGNIASQAVASGARMVKSLTLGPITQGFEEYATNLNSIQTILANTESQGSTLKDVNAALAELNTYSDKTIYNFSEMAKNIGTFTAAGVDLKTSTQSIKGIANLAALSGSNSQQASTAMYQLSQAIASGRVSLQDWNSVVNAGMGGAIFQRALATTASNMGTIADGALKVDKATGKATINGKSFRESIQASPGKESWLTSDVLTTTLKHFTGDLTDAQLKAEGFNESQIKAIQQTAKTAQNAATQVKTLKQVFDVAKESIGSGWAKTFEVLFGDFGEAKHTFTALSQAISGVISTSADARNKILGDWKELGGRKVLIEGLKDAWAALRSVIKPIHDAFREIFPKKTGEELYSLTVRFRDLMEKLKLGPETADNLKRTFRGFFAILDIGKQIVTGIIGVFGKLLGASKEGAGGILGFTGGIGDFLVALDNALKKGGILTGFFNGLAKVLEVPLHLLSGIATAIGSVFGGFDAGKGDAASISFHKLGDSLGGVGGLLDGVKKAFAGLLKIQGAITNFVNKVAAEIGKLFGGIGKTIADGIANADFGKVFQVLQTALLGGIFLALKNAIGDGFTLKIGALDNLSKTFGTLNKSLVALQTNVKAKTLLEIALAMGALAAAVVVLSGIDPGDLAKAMTTIAVGLSELIAAMAVLAKVANGAAFLTLPFIAASMIGVALALDLLAISIKVFSKMKWEELAKGLAGVAGSLVAIAAGVKLIPPNIALVGPALIPLAIALNLIAVAVKVFGSMDLISLGKGLAAVALSLVAIAAGMKLMPPTLLLTGAGLAAVGVALNLIAAAMKIFGSMDLKSIGKGLLGLAGSLVAIAAGIALMPPTMALQAAGLILVGIALAEIAAAMKLFGSTPIKTIAKGLIAMGAALAILAVGLTAMALTIPGAVALLAAATALAILVPMIALMGSLKILTIAKGLGAIGLAILVLGGAGAIAAPGLILLGVAVVALGVGVAAIGGGVYLLAKGLSLLGSEGAKGVAVLIAAFTALVAVLPKVIVDFIKGMVDVVKSIADIAPRVVDAMVKIVASLLDVVIKSAPKMALAFGAVIQAGIKVIVDNLPDIITAGFKMLSALLSGIANNIGMVVITVGSIIVNFLTALASQLPRLIAAGVTTLLKFLEGIVTSIPKIVAAGVNIIVKFIEGITANIGKVVDAAANLIVKFVGAIASNIGKVVSAGGDLIVKFLKGIADNVKKVTNAAADMMGDFVQAAADAIVKLTDRIAKIIIKFINALAESIRANSKALGDAGANLIRAIIDGAVEAIGTIGGQLVHSILGLFGSLPGKVKKLLGIHSPSTVFMEIGKNMMLGAQVGVDNSAPGVNRSIADAADGMIETMSSTLKAVPDILDGIMDLDPVITPVLDLTAVQAGAKQLAGLTNVTPITAAASFDQAAAISASQEAASLASISTADVPNVTEIKFEQNNTSPVALSSVEIYRQTKNQLAQAKKVLEIAS